MTDPLGKLKLNLPLAEIIAGQQQRNRVVTLLITLEQVLALQDLSPHHGDPFDRLLIAQTKVDSAFLVSNDSVFADYRVNLLW